MGHTCHSHLVSVDMKKDGASRKTARNTDREGTERNFVIWLSQDHCTMDSQKPCFSICICPLLDQTSQHCRGEWGGFQKPPTLDQVAIDGNVSSIPENAKLRNSKAICCSMDLIVEPRESQEIEIRALANTNPKIIQFLRETFGSPEAW